MEYKTIGNVVFKYNKKTGWGRQVLVVLPTNCTKKLASEMAKVIADKLNEKERRE